MNYGEKIAALRKSKGMTQAKLGKLLNVTYQAVSKWERGESMPDFPTLSQIAKLFNVPISYFEDGVEMQSIQPTADGENGQSGESQNSDGQPQEQTDGQSAGQQAEQPTQAVAQPRLLGVCTVCGRMISEGEEFLVSPKLVCNDCHERLVSEEERKQKIALDRENRERERRRQEQLGNGFDVKLIISLVVAVVAYVLLTVFCFIGDPSDRELKAAILLLAPLAAFAIIHVVADFINDLRDKDDDLSDGYRRNLSLIIGGAFALVNIILFLILFLMSNKFYYYIVLMVIGMLVSFTFISQFMWGGAIHELFTCGGFTFKIPGIIFALDMDSIIMMIVLKIVLGLVAILVFIVTTVFFAVVSMLGSVITFIPSVIAKTVKDKKA